MRSDYPIKTNESTSQLKRSTPLSVIVLNLGIKGRSICSVVLLSVRCKMTLERQDTHTSFLITEKPTHTQRQQLYSVDYSEKKKRKSLNV